MSPLDPAPLDKLVCDCGDPAFVGGLVGRFRSLLGERVLAVEERLRERDVDAALDRVLSLKVASATVGARELVGLAGRLQDDLARGDLTEALHHAHQLPPAATRADTALADYQPAV